MHRRRVCVFCGASPGLDPGFVDLARTTGRLLAEGGFGVVYGGASIGMMGALADAALAAGGEVIGVIPEAMKERELAHPGLSALHVVRDMHSRKALMAQLAHGFIALPGGSGTMDELFEIWTWAQLGLHDKPIVLVNPGGYYDALVGQIDVMLTRGLLSTRARALLEVVSAETAVKGVESAIAGLTRC